MTKDPQSSSTPPPSASDSAIEQKLVQFAEQLGYVVGTVHAKADGWLDRESLRAQITGVRDAAAALLRQVAGPVRRARKAAPKPRVQKKAVTGRGPVDAPGKRHRKPAATAHGVKHSDERIPKLRLAKANRQRRRG